MPVFLVLSSLSLAFYVVLLVALYHDSRRRGFNTHSVRNVNQGVLAEISTARAVGGNELASQRQSPPRVILRPTVAASPQNLHFRVGVGDSPKLASMRVWQNGDSEL